MLDPTDVLEFTAELPDDTIEKHAGIDLRVVDVQLTTLDPYDTWATSCDPAVYACIAATHPQQSELGHCGDYRPVQRCVYADACVVEGERPLALSPIDATPLVAAREYYVTSEVPCHNCTDFADTYVLFYSLVNRVIAFDAGHGFDS